MTLRKRRIILAISTLAFFAIAPLLIFYTLGYRIDGGFNIGRTGGVYISSPMIGSKIFIKNKIKKTTNLVQNGIFLGSLSVGNYPVSVEKEGFLTWQKNLEIEEGLVAEARAFLIPINPKNETILKGNFLAIWSSPYNKIILLEESKSNAIKTTFYLPDTNTFLIDDSSKTTKLLLFKNGISKISWEEGAVVLSDGKNVIRAKFDLNKQIISASIIKSESSLINGKCEKFSNSERQRLWYDQKEKNIWVEWLGNQESIPYYICNKKPCEEKNYLVLSFPFSFKNMDFLPGRKDIILVAQQNGVFAIEIDGNGGRNSQPIYKGKDPTFAVFNGDKRIYILDDGVLGTVNLE